jgi:hypothetical protein
MRRALLIFRDGKKHESSLTLPLADGEQGNMQTLAAMAQIVREDRLESDLRIFVLREVVGDVRGHDHLGELRRCFEFARDRITYRRDPWGVERVADIWSTLYALNPETPEGDCGIKSMFLASCAAILGFRPSFVVIKQRPDQRAFNHLYVGIPIEGKMTYFDPTPQDAPIGWEVKSYSKFLYPIF